MRLLDDAVPLFLVFFFFLKDLHTATHTGAPTYIKKCRGSPFPTPSLALLFVDFFMMAF